MANKIIWLKETLKRCFSRPGLFYAIISCFFFATSSLIVHILNEIHAVQTVFFRSFVHLIFITPMLIYEGVNPLPKRDDLRESALLVFRGLTASAALCFQFYALQHMPLSDATVLIFSAPLFTALLAHCFLPERLGKMDAVSAILCFLGVVMIAQPRSLFLFSFQSKHFLSCCIAVTGAILTSISIITLKKVKRLHFSTSSFYLAFMGSVATGLPCLIPGLFRPIVCGHQLHVIGIGLCAVGRYLCLIVDSYQLRFHIKDYTFF